jgi:acetyl esterase/lipase
LEKILSREDRTMKTWKSKQGLYKPPVQPLLLCASLTGFALVEAALAEKKSTLGQPAPAKVAYGVQERQGLDFYPAEPAPVRIHFHDGGWRRCNKRGANHLLPQVLHNGIFCILINYRFISGVEEGVSSLGKAPVNDAKRAEGRV